HTLAPTPTTSPAKNVPTTAPYATPPRRHNAPSMWRNPLPCARPRAPPGPGRSLVTAIRFEEHVRHTFQHPPRMRLHQVDIFHGLLQSRMPQNLRNVPD